MSVIAVVGLATMGMNLARNLARNGFGVSVYNRTTSRVDDFMKQYGSEGAFTPAHTPEELQRWHAEFMRTRILPMVSAPARALVRSHLDRGDLCAVITATNSFVTAPIAREFGVGHLIATEPESRDGRFTGRVAGTPCFRDGKVRRLEEWLSAQGRRLEQFAESRFYSDSHNDLPLLERVSRPVAVDPDDELRAQAARRGWEVMSLRR